MSQYEVDVVAKVQDSALDAAQAKLDKLTKDEKHIKVDVDIHGIKNIDLSKQFKLEGIKSGKEFNNAFKKELSSDNKFKPNFDFSKQQAEIKKATEKMAEQIQKSLNKAGYNVTYKDSKKFADEQIRTFEQNLKNQSKEAERIQSEALKSAKKNSDAYYKELFEGQFKERHTKNDTLKDMASYYENQSKEAERIQSEALKSAKKNSDAYYKELFEGQFKERHTKNDTLKDMASYYENQSKEAERIQSDFNSIQRKLSSSKLDLDVSNLGKQIKNLEYSLDGSEFKNLESSLKNVNDLSKKLKGNFDDSFNLKSGSNINDVIEDYNRLQKAIEKCNNETKIAANSQSGLLKHNEGLIASDKTLSWLNKNTKAVKDYGTALSDLAEKQRNATTKGELQTLNAQVKAIQQEAILAGKTGNSFFSELKRATFQIAEFAGVYGMIQNVVMDGGREMLQSIVDVNSAMIELQKVSSAPQNQINSYFDNATESAVKYGAKISEVIQSTADWSRLGYGLKDAEKLSDVTTLLTNVGDNMTQQKSSEGLISTLKGFNMQASQAESIIDKVNEVANTQPIDTAGIFEGLKRSASSMSAANNTLSETIALITAANSVVQDPSTIGTAFKTKFLQIVFMYRNVHRKHI